MRKSLLQLALGLLALPSTVFAAFGITSSSGVVTVDSGAGLVIKINSSNGDITSIVYSSKQLQDSSKFTHISSGLGSVTTTTSVSGNYAKVTLKTSTLTQTYVVVNGQNNLYISTYTTAEPSVGELRFIARLSKSALPNGVTAAEVNGGTAIEGSDVFLLNGQTRSKFYSSKRFIEDQVHGVTGSGVGVWMVLPGTAYETSSGGPFMRDINNQGSSQQELYWYMNSGHEQTESFRTGFFGPYALVFNSGSTPSASLDTSFFGSLGVTGYVGSSSRGKVTGSISNVQSGYTVVVGFKNSAQQYWTTASGSSYTSPLMKPGTYTVTLFKGELEVGTGSASVSAGGTTTVNLSSNEYIPSALWSIGNSDGTPKGFLNADKIETMHPSDSRMSSWGPVTYTIGSSSASSWPMAQFISVNNGNKIVWTASSSQIGARTLVIRITSSFASGRPVVTVNSWTSSTPAAPTKIDSRGVTRGTWRGNNQAFTYSIPSGTLIAGKNTFTINVASGSTGDTFLSPNIVYDSIVLY
ncbi:hypothetical protein FRC15_007716 [Serendipita sp. 397]|nr:hypothetical protein FRC15_007716 [Serendipita sp. 397]